MNEANEGKITHTIITDKMVFGGKTLTKINGKNVFIPMTMPGERLKIKILQSRSDYDEAAVEEILEPSPHRREPPCPLYGRCGGCNMMHIDDGYQTELKMQILSEFIKKAAGRSPEIKLVGGSALGYRNRMTLHDGGLEERGSNHVIPVNRCPVASDGINAYLKETPFEERPRGRCRVFESPAAEPEISVLPIATATPESGEKAFYGSDKSAANGESRRQRLQKGRHFIKKRFEGISGASMRAVRITLCEKSIAFDAQGFFQSNVGVLEKTIPLITKDFSGERVLDLYSGAGTFSVFLAESFKKVTMVEHNRGALVFAEQNMAGLSHESYGISGADFVKNNARGITAREGNFDAVLADPPRSGMEREVLDWLCESGIRRVKYLSCNPSTQTRDIERLVRAGYKIDEVHLLDFYPQTSQLETLITCSLK